MSTILSIYKQDQVQILEVMGSNPEFDMKGDISSKPWASVLVLAGWEWCRFGDREMMVLMTCSACFFVCLVVFVSTQEHLPKRGATDSRVSPPASIINEGKSPQTCPYADPVEAIARLRWPSFQMTLCRAGKKKPTSTVILSGRHCPVHTRHYGGFPDLGWLYARIIAPVM